MGNLHGQLTEIMADTLAEVARKRKVKYNTLWKKAKRKFPSEVWAEDSAVLPEHMAVLFPEKSVAKRIIRTPAQHTVNQPAPAIIEAMPPAPGRAKRQWPAIKLPTFHQVRRFTISLLLFAVVVAHGLLIWYDCAILWGVPGQIGGGTVFIVVLAALLLASDSTLPRTSGNALAFIFFVDCAAWKVHYEVFKTPVVDNIVTGSLCAFICAASFIALYLFRDSKLD